MCSTVNGDVSDLSTTTELAPLQTELLSSNVDSKDCAEQHIVEGSVHRDCRPLTDDILSSEYAADDSNSNLSAEKLKKLKLMNRGTCRYNEVRWRYTINRKL